MIPSLDGAGGEQASGRQEDKRDHSGTGRAADEYRKTVLQIIEDQPTAFDKEKVIEELEATTHWESSEPADDDGYIDDYYNNEVIDIDKAIEIVEKGGIE